MHFVDPLKFPFTIRLVGIPYVPNGIFTATSEADVHQLKIRFNSNVPAHTKLEKSVHKSLMKRLEGILLENAGRETREFTIDWDDVNRAYFEEYVVDLKTTWRVLPRKYKMELLEYLGSRTAEHF
ncbi:hypothetical protein WBG78_28360 [Chryseolinea sp. T2]|uniref:hypothetical protein n=1 Tax=Chryseolinea sp. T2 TaxID=3129255 RepID=UPI003076DC4D